MTIKNANEYSLKKYEEDLEFGDFVRSIRRSDSITQEELAIKLNCSKQYISGIENGKDSVTIEVARKIAEALGYSTSAFVEVLLNAQLKKANMDFRIKIKKSA